MPVNAGVISKPGFSGHRAAHLRRRRTDEDAWPSEPPSSAEMPNALRLPQNAYKGLQKPTVHTPSPFAGGARGPSWAHLVADVYIRAAYVDAAVYEC